MKVVFVVTCLTWGGAQVALYRLLSKLDRGIEAHVISLQAVDEVGIKIQELGITVEALGMKPGIPNPLAVLRLAWRLRALRPDIVQTWMYHADLLGGMAAKLALLQAPVVWCIHHSNLSPNVNKRATLLVVKVCAWLSIFLPSKSVFCAVDARRVHEGTGYRADKALVIPNGIDLAHFMPDPAARASMRHDLGIDEATPVIGMLARFDPIKNHQGFVRSAKMIHARTPECRFVLAGANVDSSNAELVGWIGEAGLRQHIHLLGERADIPRVIAALDVLALSSWGEALPTVVAEAMACEIPCVVTDVGDAARMVGGTGFVVVPGDDLAFAQACQTVLALDPVERASLGDRARTRIAQQYDLTAMARAYKSLYDLMIGVTCPPTGSKPWRRPE